MKYIFIESIFFIISVHISKPKQQILLFLDRLLGSTLFFLFLRLLFYVNILLKSTLTCVSERYCINKCCLLITDRRQVKHPATYRKLCCETPG